LFSRLGSDDKVFGTIGKPEEVKDRYAVTKLELWNVVFNNMERQGQMIHMKLSEVQSVMYWDDGDLGRQWKLYYRETVARFMY
jgi:hypothetical protein